MKLGLMGLVALLGSLASLQAQAGTRIELTNEGAVMITTEVMSDAIAEAQAQIDQEVEKSCPRSAGGYPMIKDFSIKMAGGGCGLTRFIFKYAGTCVVP